MRRSLLFIPANNPAMLQNAEVFESDAVIFDLEDAVSPTEKDSARQLLSCFLEANPKLPCEVIVRINGMDTDLYHQDLEKILSNKIDAIMLPKARVQDLKKLNEILDNYDFDIAIVPIIELAISLLEVNEIAAERRVNGILLGAEDLTSDLEVERTKAGDEIFYARSKVALACSAYKIDAIDTPFTDVTDNVGLAKDIQTAKTLAMKAKAAIHPNQIELINELFAPSQKLIEWATRVLIAKDEALKNGIGVFSLDGKMVDKPVYERAIKIIEKAKKFKVI